MLATVRLLESGGRRGGTGSTRRRTPGSDSWSRRLGRLFEAGLHEAEAQQALGVDEGHRARAGAQHDHEELLAVAPGRHREVVAGLVGEAGLERLHAARIAEERDVARVHTAVVDEGLAAQERP